MKSVKTRMGRPITVIRSPAPVEIPVTVIVNAATAMGKPTSTYAVSMPSWRSMR
jgi:hypothetical protein